MREVVKRRAGMALGAALAAAAGLALVTVPSASAAPVTGHGVLGNNCFVDISVAPFYDANWHQQGLVGRGQGFYEHGWLGNGWYIGDLWGGATNVRMNANAFGPPCGD